MAASIHDRQPATAKRAWHAQWLAAAALSLCACGGDDSPEAQLRKQDPKVWGDPTVLSMEKLPPQDRASFAALDLGVATLKPEELGATLDEPHASWMTRIEAEWVRRYGVAN